MHHDERHGWDRKTPRQFLVATELDEQQSMFSPQDIENSDSYEDCPSLESLGKTQKRVPLSKVVSMCLRHWHNSALVEAQV